MSFQERKVRLAILEEEKIELTCRLHMVSNVVSDKEEYYEDLLGKWKTDLDKTIQNEANGRVKREMKWWEQKRIEKLKARWEEELSVKHVDKLMQTVRLDPVEVSPVGI